MPFFKIDGFNISALSKQQADIIHRAAPSRQGRRLIIIPKDGSKPRIVELEIGPGFDICTQDGDDITFAGGLIGGSGEKLMQVAADSLDKTRSYQAKLGQKRKSEKIEKKYVAIAERVDIFESTIPDSMRPLYDDVMEGMQCTTDAYILDMIQGFEGVQFKPENWQPLLSWFKMNVLDKEIELPLDEKRTFFALRKAFVTAGIRMVNGDARNANSMRLVQKVKSDFDWGKYAEEKNKS